MPPPVRKTVLVLHVITAVGWLGVTFGDLALGATALLTDDPELQHAMLRGLGVIADVVLIPIAWAAFLTGLLLALGTKWGLVRHKWVLTKFVLTTVVVLLTTFSLVPELKSRRDAVEGSAADQLVPLDEMSMISAGIVSTSIYTICVVLSLVKPWGRTRWGR
ncbi:hypothetical protein BU204_12090 [Actinophytocola xanthii]|uniref:DUF2269 domain-containing protein n=2 Tax=Actinophytocola xanthii TaxID=1912961 RepID=A0A1Q8CSP3_9PSEU|nr:hypothetical protein BU204_12090 [Actinophytocola xanthii]